MCRPAAINVPVSHTFFLLFSSFFFFFSFSRAKERERRGMERGRIKKERKIYNNKKFKNHIKADA